MPGEKEEILWNVATHEHHERSADWYWTLGVLALVGAGISAFVGNFLFAVIIIVAAVSIGFLVARGPREHAVKIDRRGVSLDGTLYPYSSIRSFWVEREAEHPHLYLSMSGILSPHFSLALENHPQALDIERYLKHFVEEEEQGPNVGERVAQLFGL